MIHFVVALPAEAGPLIERYRLQRRALRGDYPVYEGDDTALIVSGVGKVAAAAATACLHASTDGHGPGVWLNVGIAGHRQRRVGDGVLAHRVTDHQTQANWYPQLAFDPPCETADVLTVNTPEFRYTESSLYEMEAAGYYPSACRFTRLELVHCFKVVSDNRAMSADTVSAKAIRSLIENQLEVIDHMISQLLALVETRSQIEPACR